MLNSKICALATLAACATLSAFGVHAQTLKAQTFKTLYGFKSLPDGSLPAGGVTAHGGMLYGTTNTGGTSDNGTVYAVNPVTGAETLLYSFKGSFTGAADGSAPQCELLFHNGALYGTTSFGGAFNAGTVFKIDPVTALESVVYSFGASATDATAPAAGLISQSGFLFGTSSSGGAANEGTVFKVDARTGAETVLHSFASGADGAAPFAPLIFQNGVLYGTTFFGGASNDGTVFKVDPKTGTETVLHAFVGAAFEGNPAAGLTFQAGILYGTTAHGGINHCEGSSCGTVFEVDPITGDEAVLYSFKNKLDGEDPESGLVYKDGLLFGTTQLGGRSDRGTVFAIGVRSGTKILLHDFEGPNNGTNPATLIERAGALYGTTRGGGAPGFGTVFKLS